MGRESEALVDLRDKQVLLVNLEKEDVMVHLDQLALLGREVKVESVAQQELQVPLDHVVNVAQLVYLAHLEDLVLMEDLVKEEKQDKQVNLEREAREDLWDLQAQLALMVSSVFMREIF